MNSLLSQNFRSSPVDFMDGIWAEHSQQPILGHLFASSDTHQIIPAVTRRTQHHLAALAKGIEGGADVLDADPRDVCADDDAGVMAFLEGGGDGGGHSATKISLGLLAPFELRGLSQSAREGHKGYWRYAKCHSNIIAIATRKLIVSG